MEIELKAGPYDKLDHGNMVLKMKTNQHVSFLILLFSVWN
jgi:hypothetical protein